MAGPVWARHRALLTYSGSQYGSRYMLWSIGAYWVALAYASEPSERTFNASAALIGAATFALTSDIASRSGSAAADSLSTSWFESSRRSNDFLSSSLPQSAQTLLTSMRSCSCPASVDFSSSADLAIDQAPFFRGCYVVGGVMPVLWSIGVFCWAAAAAIEPSDSTLSAAAMLIGTARFAFTSDMASRSGRAVADSLSTSFFAS